MWWKEASDWLIWTQLEMTTFTMNTNFLNKLDLRKDVERTYQSTEKNSHVYYLQRITHHWLFQPAKLWWKKFILRIERLWDPMKYSSHHEGMFWVYTFVNSYTQKNTKFRNSSKWIYSSWFRIFISLKIHTWLWTDISVTKTKKVSNSHTSFVRFRAHRVLRLYFSSKGFFKFKKTMVTCHNPFLHYKQVRVTCSDSKKKLELNKSFTYLKSCQN